MSEIQEQSERMNDTLIEVAKEGAKRPDWTHGVAFVSLVFGLLSALGAMLAGAAANEAILERTREILDMQTEHSDRLEAAMLRQQILLLRSLDEPVNPALDERQKALDAEGAALEIDQSRMERFVEASVDDHEILEAAVTLFAIAISFFGMSVIIQRRHLFWIGLGVGSLGLALFGWGVLRFL
jgi:hypothetical protein